jgi:integrase/recombinase XerD
MNNPKQLPLFGLRPRLLADVSVQTPLEYAIPFFQQHLYKDGKTEHTVNSFTSDLGVLVEFGAGNLPLGQIDTELLTQFLDWMEHRRGVPCSRKTYARRVTTLKVFFKWLKDQQIIPYDPATLLVQRSGPAPLAEILTERQIEAALSAALLERMKEKADARPEFLFRLILMTGMKKSEAMSLQVDHFDRTTRPPMLTIKAQSAKQVYKARLIALEASIIPLLDEYRSQYPSDGVIFTCTPRNLEYILERIGDGAQIGVKISFEMLRWTCAVRDYRAGMPPQAIRDKLGLSDMSWRETFDKVKRLAGDLDEDSEPQRQ